MATILLVEDDRWLGDMYMDALMAAKHEVLRSANAQEALLALDDTAMIDVIVLDIFLPQYNGIALLHELRTSPIAAEIPVIIQSGVSMQRSGLVPATWTSYGIAAYLCKTEQRPHDLVRTIKKVLDETT